MFIPTTVRTSNLTKGDDLRRIENIAVYNEEFSESR
jgi:hypothetical protein